MAVDRSYGQFIFGVTALVTLVIVLGLYFTVYRSESDTVKVEVDAFVNTINASLYGNAWMGLHQMTRDRISRESFERLCAPQGSLEAPLEFVIEKTEDAKPASWVSGTLKRPQGSAQATIHFDDEDGVRKIRDIVVNGQSVFGPA